MSGDAPSSRRPRRREPSEEDRLLAWDRWLDGHSAGSIRRHDLFHLPEATVRGILSGPPPDRIADDLRHRLAARFLWVHAEGIENPATGTTDAFVVVQSPRSYTAKAFTSAIRAVRRLVREAVPGADLDLGVIQAMEPEVAARFVDERGYRGFRFDESGAATAIDRIGPPQPVPEAASP